MHKSYCHSGKKDATMESELQLKHFPGRSVYKKMTLEHLCYWAEQAISGPRPQWACYV